MSAIAKETPTNKDFDQLKTRLKATWMTGDYDLFSRYMEKDAEVFFRRLGIQPGTRLLDVGCGAGQLALIAAREGAQVTGCDISTNWLENARTRAAAEGLHITHWTSQDLARQAVADGIVDAISPRTVQRILHAVDLQPHRTRYWRTPRLDPQFKERAEQVLWCYGNAERLARQGIWTVAVDEKPNLQVLERYPIRRAIPGSIEQQEFEYTRHGTVNLLFFLIVHTGRMEVAVEAKKDADHYIRELKAFRQRHRGLKGVFLVQDGDPSHTAGDTAEYWSESQGWWRPRFTPAHASWLDQAELLIGAFGYHYLKRGSRATREELIKHVLVSAPEYNRLYAHPFDWTWTNQKMRLWFAEHAP